MKLFTKRKVIGILTILTVSFLLFSITDGSITGSVIGNKDYCKDCNVVIILIDTLRADHLSAYGYERKSTPHIDSLSDDGLIFKNMFSQTSWTKPATASILTGLYPKNHKASTRESSLSQENILISETLQENGYDTYAFSTNAFITEEAGFNQGFSEFFYFPREEYGGKPYAKAEEVNKKLIPLIENISNKKKFFFYIHYMDPHAPYDPDIKKYSSSNTLDFSVEDFITISEREVDKMKNNNKEKTGEEIERLEKNTKEKTMQQLVNLYDDEISLVDKKIGDIIEAFKNKNLFEKTIFIIVSDHGEEFMEHGELTHGKTLYRESLKVPLIINLPSNKHIEISKLTQQIDIVPSLLSLLKIDSNHEYDGINIFKEDREKYFSELNYDGRVFTLVSTMDDKLIEGVVNGSMSNSRWMTFFEKETYYDLVEGLNKIPVVSFHKKVKIEITDEFGNFIQNITIPTYESELQLQVEVPGRIKLTTSDPCTPTSDFGMISNRCLTFGIWIKDKDPLLDSEKIHPFKHYYYLKDDPFEKTNLFNEDFVQERIEVLEKDLFKHVATISDIKVASPVSFTDENLEILKALGYVN